jgi:hypothetical protein
MPPQIEVGLDELFFFFLREPCIFQQGDFSTSAVVGYQPNWLEGMKYSSVDHPSSWGLQGFTSHWSEKVKTACRFKIYSARGLALGV